MQFQSARSLRRAYLEWVEEQIEEYKDSISRSDLLHLANQVCEDLRVTQGGQYQLTEVLLCTAVDRAIFRQLRLPGYRSWRQAQMERLEQAMSVDIHPASEVAPPPVRALEPVAVRA